VPEDEKKTRYSFLFPLRPGTTQFQVAYQLPYTGSANVDPKSVYPLQHFVAILPKSMQFTAAPGANYIPRTDPQQPDANVQLVSDAKVGDPLAFKVSGEGTLQARQEGAGAPSDGESQQGAQGDNRPGGGLGPPIDAPHPVQRYELWVLIGLGAALGVGGVSVGLRQQSAKRAGRAAGTAENIDDESEADGEIDSPRDSRPRLSPARYDGRVRSAANVPQTVPRPTSMLLEGLKEEIFQLEVEHKQGLISQEEYEKTKSALDQTLQRALKRESAPKA
jgi:hypothetical protein